MKESILSLIADAPAGLTSVEMAASMACPRRVVMTQLAALKAACAIEATGEYRHGAAVLIVRRSPLQLNLLRGLARQRNASERKAA